MPNNILRFWQHGSDDPLDVLFEVAPILMHSIDEDGRLIDVSTFWAKKLGYTRDEMVGLPSTDFLTPESRDHAVNKVLPAFFKTGSAYNVEYEFVRRNGDVIPVLMSAVGQYTEEGEYIKSLAVMFDNSETKRLNAELSHNQRMKALGQLVGGVAHDFNNILTVIKGNTEFLRDDPDNPLRVEHLRDMWRSAERGATLTQMLLAYGQQSRLEPALTDLNKSVRDIDEMLRRVMPNKLDISVVTAGGLWGANLDPHRLETALVNLVNNARDAMPKGGKITIETCNVRISEDYIDVREEDILPGRYVMLAVSDTGDGIKPDVLDRIFEPYFTTKPVGMGSGLGLSMVFGYVKQSGGTIRVYSEEGFGTTFKLYFPAVKFPADNTNDERRTNSAPAGPEPMAEILLVEDEHDVRRVLSTQIGNGGFSVSQAVNGDAAFTLLTTGYRPKVLVTDIIMPGALQGPELAVKAREIVDGLKVIFVSGMPQEAAIHGNGVGANDVLLTKPINSSRLVSEIARLLQETDCAQI